LSFSSTVDDREVNEEIETQIEEAKKRGTKMRFFHYTALAYEPVQPGLMPGSYAATRGNLYYYEARQKLGVNNPNWVYPVDVDPRVTPVIPRGLTGQGFGFGGEPQVEFPAGTPPGSVQPGKLTYR